MADTTIEIAASVSAELSEAFQRLVPQLSRSNLPPTSDELQLIIDSPASTMFVARLDSVIVGTLTLVAFRIPTGVRTLIEDVVVDSAARGAGVAAAMTHAAIAHARSLGATTVDLTSRPSRQAANRLYQRLGFVQRETNVYRYELG
jgi:ribosomal protein S18 acetylase RimI-like enzyme